MSRSSEWFLLGDLSFAVYDLGSERVEKYNPDSDTKAYFRGLRERAAESFVELLYQEILDWEALNIEHKRYPRALRYALGFEQYYSNTDKAPDIPSVLVESIISDIGSSSIDPEEPLNELEITGIPDLLVFSRDEPERYAFVEVKAPPEDLRVSQKEWLGQFDFLPRKIACMFNSPKKCNRFVQDGGFRKMLENPVEPGSETPPEMSSEEIAMVIKNVEVGDRILFNERKLPLTVEEKDVTEQVMTKEITGVKVSSSSGSTVLSNDGKWFKGGTYRRNLWWINVVD